MRSTQPAHGAAGGARHRFKVHYDDDDKKWHELAEEEVPHTQAERARLPAAPMTDAVHSLLSR